MASQLACSNHDETSTNTNTAEESVPEPELDIVINNVVCSFNIRCHLNLKHIALNGCNVEYKRENGMVTMKLRKPRTTASIWSSGKITCTGATSNEDARKASRRFAKIIQQLGFNVKFANFRIVNVLGTCSMPFAIKISHFATAHRKDASYEPELHPGVTYKIKDLRATLKIFSTGSITVTAPSIDNVQSAVEHIYPLVYEFRRDLPPPPNNTKPKAVPIQQRNVQNNRNSSATVQVDNASDDSLTSVEEDEEENMFIDMNESDASWG